MEDKQLCIIHSGQGADVEAEYDLLDPYGEHMLLCEECYQELQVSGLARVIENN